MKLQCLAASGFVLLGLASFACSSANDDIMMGSDSGGSSAGTQGQGASGSAAGGSKSNGGSGGSKSNGGSSSNGGEASGGSSSAGTATGGGSTGGTGTGGGSAGESSSGGSAGAPSASCEQDTDCVACGYTTAPATAQDCYCLLCENTPMSKAECSANQAQYQKVCAKVVLPCPAVKCLPPPQPTCTNHVCVAK